MSKPQILFRDAGREFARDWHWRGGMPQDDGKQSLSVLCAIHHAIGQLESRMLCADRTLQAMRRHLATLAKPERKRKPKAKARRKRP
jgi:hypothetical protein